MSKTVPTAKAFASALQERQSKEAAEQAESARRAHQIETERQEAMSKAFRPIQRYVRELIKAGVKLDPIDAKNPAYGKGPGYSHTPERYTVDDGPGSFGIRAETVDWVNFHKVTFVTYSWRDVGLYSTDRGNTFSERKHADRHEALAAFLEMVRYRVKAK